MLFLPKVFSILTYMIVCRCLVLNNLFYLHVKRLVLNFSFGCFTINHKHIFYPANFSFRPCLLPIQDMNMTRNELFWYPHSLCVFERHRFWNSSCSWTWYWCLLYICKHMIHEWMKDYFALYIYHWLQIKKRLSIIHMHFY